MNPPGAYNVYLVVSARYAVLRFNQYFKTKPAVMALEIPKWEDKTARTAIAVESEAFRPERMGYLKGKFLDTSHIWLATSQFHKSFFPFLNTRCTFSDATSSFSSSMFYLQFMYCFWSTCWHQFVLWYFLFPSLRGISEWFAVQGSHKIRTDCSFCPAVAL